MKNRSVMEHAFSRVPTVSMPRSVFNRSSGHKTAFDAGNLIPMYVDEILPGDSVNLKQTILIRLLSASLRPFMDNLFVDTFWFFVPNRLLWSNFKKFMGEQDNPSDSISYTVPQVTAPNVASGGITIGHLYDYMGLPVGALSGGGATTGITFNNLHGRAYNQIWNKWFRDQNLQNSVTEDVGDGPDTYTNYNLLSRGKRFDYFTSALPNLQKGSTAVSLPLGTSAIVKTSASQSFTGAQNAIKFRDADGSTSFTASRAAGFDDTTISSSLYRTTLAATSAGTGVYPSNLYADLSLATASTINDLRQSIALQQFLEKDARGGTRYTELVKSHFGVTSPDARLQRPELLATNSVPLKLNPVANTASTTAATNYQGTLSGYGTAIDSNGGFTKSFTEHGVLIGLISVRADLTYQQGMDRMWSRRTRYDYFWPIYSTLGEQSILNREIYANLADGTGAAQKDGTFGYQERYGEYRYKPSKITGNLRSYNGASVNANTLDIWHLSQAFSSQPTLNSTFITDSPPVDRVIAVPSAEHFIADMYFESKWARPMPVFNIPGLTKL